MQTSSKLGFAAIIGTIARVWKYVVGRADALSAEPALSVARRLPDGTAKL